MTIVVVDDRASNRLILEKLASSLDEDVQVQMFADPLTALDYVEKHTPDLLITDFKMEPFDGDELIRRFRRVPACAEVPVVVVTAFHDVEFRDRALRAGSTNFLESPIDHDDFRSRIRGLLAIRREWVHLHNRSLYADSAALGDQLAAEATTEMVSVMLQDVNVHLVATLGELELLKNNLQIIVSEYKVAAIFVDAAMNVRRATPAILTMFGRNDDSVESLLAAVTKTLKYNDLSKDFAQMLESEEPVQRYLESIEGDHFVVKWLPNRATDRSITGAIITFTKIPPWQGGRA